MLLSPWGRRWWLFLSATTLRGSVAPSRPRCPPSSRYGSASSHRTSPAPPMQTPNTSRKSATELCFIPFLQQNLTFIGKKMRQHWQGFICFLCVFLKVVFCCFASFWHFRVSIENWTGEGDHRHLEYASSNVLQLWLRTLIIHCLCRCFLFYFFK